MAQLILRNGGTEGGILISNRGQRRIAPFDPGLSNLMKGVSSLVSSLRGQPDGDRQDLEALVNKVSNYMVGRVEATIGSLDNENAIIYDDVEGGFVCGSEGKLPVPIPPFPIPMPSYLDLVNSGMVDPDMVRVIEEANSKNIDILDLFESPLKTSKSMGLAISDRTAKDFSILAPSNVKNIKDPISREVVEFFHTVAKDGRFLEKWLLRPVEVAEEIGVKLSDEAAGRITMTATGMAPEAGIIVAVGVGIILVIAVIIGSENNVGSPFVIDRSGINKF